MIKLCHIFNLKPAWNSISLRSSAMNHQQLSKAMKFLCTAEMVKQSNSSISFAGVYLMCNAWSEVVTTIFAIIVDNAGIRYLKIPQTLEPGLKDICLNVLLSGS